jgi:hypothetical protein
VGSMRHRGPLGSDPAKETARADFSRGIGPGISAVLGRCGENDPRPFSEFLNSFSF